MAKQYDLTFTDHDFRAEPLETGTYETCTFIRCQLEKADLSESAFIDCQFEDCDLSLVDVRDTALREVHFQGCKMVGLAFHNCHEFLFQVGFTDCNLHLSSFVERMLKHTRFKGCDLREVDFSQANLTKAIFDGCDLKDAIFERTNLVEADFRTARRFSIDPEMNPVKKARFSQDGLAGLLHKYQLRIS
ncbi:MAG: pentapeptide repeat-containing protein [Bacteroidota bacterium]